MNKPSKPKASFGTEKTNAPGVLARATTMETAITAAAAMFTSLPITMAAFLLLIQAATTAQANAATRTKGLAALRDTKIDALWTAMMALKIAVQSQADTLDAVAARSLIEAAGLLVAKTPAHEKALLTATYVTATSLVHLAVNATLLAGQRRSRTRTFTWSWSTDGGKSWSPGITTGYASADVPGLGPASYQFRVLATVGKTPGDWSQPATLTIH